MSELGGGGPPDRQGGVSNKRGRGSQWLIKGNGEVVLGGWYSKRRIHHLHSTTSKKPKGVREVRWKSQEDILGPGSSASTGKTKHKE